MLEGLAFRKVNKVPNDLISLFRFLDWICSEQICLPGLNSFSRSFQRLRPRRTALFNEQPLTKRRSINRTALL